MKTRKYPKSLEGWVALFDSYAFNSVMYRINPPNINKGILAMPKKQRFKKIVAGLRKVRGDIQIVDCRKCERTFFTERTFREHYLFTHGKFLKPKR